MKIIHLCDITNRKSSGVSVIVPKYVEHQSKWADVLLLNVNNEEVIPIAGEYKNITLSESISELQNGFAKPDLIVIHDIYSVRLLFYYLKYIKGKYKYIAIPHGGLMRVSQKKSHIKKMIANALFYRYYFKKAEAVQYLSSAEYNGSIHYNKRNIIIPNGISVPERKLYQVHEGAFSLIYVGRIAPLQKGLDILIEAVSLDKDYFVSNNIKVLLFGADYKNGAQYLQQLISTKGLEEIVIMNSEGLYGEEKKRKLLDSNVFIQVSRWEGMPSGLLEAFSLGLPVIVSKETGLAEDVQKSKCGFVAELNAESILKSIKVIYEEKDTLENLSSNAYELSKKYTWDKIAEYTIEEYKKL